MSERFFMKDLEKKLEEKEKIWENDKFLKSFEEIY
eukprot:CAMPEP_0170550618 /NCGR_PEP_ID=MMETSP0211-20121228/8653_1 /TAXON_ID=311385 /ORGANISM="Pseudokeronopsis sp., Strain OXSARD2" /LENGTH=34 /DNA_ID= /DNA_START= /DNA_END= /DNA_ORIENTATION=